MERDGHKVAKTSIHMLKCNMWDNPASIRTTMRDTLLSVE